MAVLDPYFFLFDDDNAIIPDMESEKMRLREARQIVDDKREQLESVVGLLDQKKNDLEKQLRKTKGKSNLLLNKMKPSYIYDIINADCFKTIHGVEINELYDTHIKPYKMRKQSSEYSIEHCVKALFDLNKEYEALAQRRIELSKELVEVTDEINEFDPLSLNALIKIIENRKYYYEPFKSTWRERWFDVNDYESRHNDWKRIRETIVKGMKATVDLEDEKAVNDVVLNAMIPLMDLTEKFYKVKDAFEKNDRRNVLVTDQIEAHKIELEANRSELAKVTKVLEKGHHQFVADIIHTLDDSELLRLFGRSKTIKPTLDQYNIVIQQAKVEGKLWDIYSNNKSEFEKLDSNLSRARSKMRRGYGSDRLKRRASNSMRDLEELDLEEISQNLEKRNKKIDDYLRNNNFDEIYQKVRDHRLSSKSPSQSMHRFENDMITTMVYLIMEIDLGSFDGTFDVATITQIDNSVLQSGVDLSDMSFSSSSFDSSSISSSSFDSSSFSSSSFDSGASFSADCGASFSCDAGC